MRSRLERYTLYQQNYERFSSPTRPREQNLRILRHSHAMNGSAGLFPSRNRKPESSILSVYARSSRKECAGLVAGLAVLTAEMRLTRLYSRCPPSGPLRFGKRQDNFAWRFDRVRCNQLCPLPWEIATEKPGNIEQRTTATNHADVMWAVADNIAFCTQDSILQRYGIQNSVALS